MSTEKRLFNIRPPDHAYLVCATPRSGSTLLCELLRATGVAGRPLEHFEVLRHSGRPRQPREYFDGVRDERVLDRLPPLRPPRDDRADESPEAWWRRILAEGTSAPGRVWGGKLMWGHAGDFVDRARELPGLAEADLDGALRALLGDVRLVFVTRRDKAAQAVSLWRAVQTETWRSDGEASADAAAYVFEGVDHLRGRLEEDEAAWRRWLDAQDRPVHEVDYEELAADPRATAAAVLRALDLPDAGVPEPAMRRQGDARSAEWVARYRAESGAPA